MLYWNDQHKKLYRITNIHACNCSFHRDMGARTSVRLSVRLKIFDEPKVVCIFHKLRRVINRNDQHTKLYRITNFRACSCSFHRDTAARTSVRLSVRLKILTNQKWYASFFNWDVWYVEMISMKSSAGLRTCMPVTAVFIEIWVQELLWGSQYAWKLLTNQKWYASFFNWDVWYIEMISMKSSTLESILNLSNRI